MIKHRNLASVNLHSLRGASFDVRFQSCRPGHGPNKMFALV
jgi:hypothetical protein